MILLDELKIKYKDTSNIIFAGPKYGEDLVEEYHNASAFVLPSSCRTMGLGR